MMFLVRDVEVNGTANEKCLYNLPHVTRGTLLNNTAVRLSLSCKQSQWARNKECGCEWREGKGAKILCSYLQSAPLLVGQPVVRKKRGRGGGQTNKLLNRQLFQIPNSFVITSHIIPTHQPDISTLRTVFRGLSISALSLRQRPQPESTLCSQSEYQDCSSIVSHVKPRFLNISVKDFFMRHFISSVNHFQRLLFFF